MARFKRTTLAFCTVALVAAVGCGNNNEDNNTANNESNQTNNESNQTNNESNQTNNESNQTNNESNQTNNESNQTNNTSNNPGASFCALECATADDCAADPTDWECNDSRCEYTATVDSCTDDAACQAQFSGWITECQADGDCPGQVCVDIGDTDAGRCATEPGAVDCATLTMVDIDTTKYEDASAITVCGNDTAACHDDGYCYEPCATDDDCAGDLVCDTATGNCGCTDDAHCTTDGADTCYDGVCGCAAEASCDALEAGGASYVCE